MSSQDWAPGCPDPRLTTPLADQRGGASCANKQQVKADRMTPASL